MSKTAASTVGTRKTNAQFRLERDGVPYVDEMGRDLTYLTGYAREYGELYYTERVLAKRRADAEREEWWRDNQRPVFTEGGVEKMISDLNRVAADSLFSDPATSRAIERL